MVAQFRSHFAFRLLTVTVMLGRSLSWFYNKRHHGKSPMDGVSGSMKNVIFRKIKLGQGVVYSPLEFTEAVQKVALLIHSIYLFKKK